MKKLLFLSALLITTVTFAQKKEPLKLTNAVVVGQMDDSADRYSIEVKLTEVLNDHGIVAIPSLNVIKKGGDSRALASDTMQMQLAEKGVDTYLLVTIRGYDRKFKPAENQVNLETELERANLFKLYQEDIVSVSVEFKFYRNNECVYVEVMKIKSIGSREVALKKFKKKLNKVIEKKWK